MFQSQINVVKGFEMPRDNRSQLYYLRWIKKQIIPEGKHTKGKYGRSLSQH